MDHPTFPRITKNLDIGDGQMIRCDVRAPAHVSGRPVVVICHSFMAFRLWGFFPHVARSLAEEGFVSVTFDFSRNGVPEGAQRISDFDSFASNTFTREISDLGRVVQAVRDGSLTREMGDPSRIALLGHSRGGGIAISYAASDPDIAALVTWSSIATFDRWTDHQKRIWRSQGFLPIGSGQAGGGLRLGPDLLREVETLLPEIDPQFRASYITAPWLILHGRADVTVPVREAELLHEAGDHRRTSLQILDAVGHLYNARTAAEDHYMTINHLIALTAGWLRERMA